MDNEKELTGELSLALETAAICNSNRMNWGINSPFQEIINTLLVKCKRNPVTAWAKIEDESILQSDVAGLDLLAEYASLAASIEEAKEQMWEIEQELKNAVDETGDKIAAYGYTARMKPGRKSIDHQQAAAIANVSADIVKQFTTIQYPSIAWAKVTKAAEVDKDILEQCTTEAPPVFVVERDKKK